MYYSRDAPSPAAATVLAPQERRRQFAFLILYFFLFYLVYKQPRVLYVFAAPLGFGVLLASATATFSGNELMKTDQRLCLHPSPNRNPANF